ncbi:MAG: D-arabinono-1,4-lactone oxidase [Myxococcota bacterium]|nr:D-arabinono-1,4-lactone oxidase [Myxococcota bacterium]
MFRTNHFGETLMFALLIACICSACSQIDEGATVEVTEKRAANWSRTTGPIKALYVTNYSNAWHNYEAQQRTLLAGIQQHINVTFSLVGKDDDDALRLLKQESYAAGYDVVVYNMCFADDMDTQRIENIIRQTRDFGVPAVLMHCAMHSFRNTSPHRPKNRAAFRAAHREWAETHPGSDFPYWWAFTGIDTTGHELPRSMYAERVDGEHPVTKWLPEVIASNRDELYINLAVKETVTPLYTVYSQRSQQAHIVAWTHEIGAGRVFATTMGHGDNTLQLTEFHQLMARGIAYVTERLDDDGLTDEGYAGTRAVENYQGTVTCQPSDVIEATSIGEVQKAVETAALLGASLKVISVKKSNSNNGLVCPEQGGMLLNLWRMNEVVELDPVAQTVTVQPGIRATELSAYLHGQGFAIRAMPDYTGVSIAGGIATGAHHSSLTIPAGMADMVQGIKIIDGLGRLRVFDGDDAAQDAVHLGMLGIVVEVTLSIEPQFKLQYGHEKGNDEALEDTIEDMVRAHEYARVMWFAGNQRYVMDYYDRVPSSTDGASRHNLWSSTGGIFRWVGDLPYQVLNRAPLRAQCDSALVRSKVWLAPIKAIDSPSNAPVGWSHEMLGSTCQPGSCPWDSPRVQSRTMEVAFPLSQIREWMQDVRGIIGQNRACFPILGIYLRFSKASDRWMGFNYGEDMVAFEIHIPKVANETRFERSSAVYDEIIQMSLRKYNGRPHWGKNSNAYFVGLGPEQYPQWNAFVELKNELDPNGLFDNQIWRQIIGSTQVKAYPGCVLARDCICAQDSDCGDNFRCETGGHFTEARVCRR